MGQNITNMDYDDVEYSKVELGQILEYKQPTKYLVKSTNYKNEYRTPVLTAGKSFLLGYTDEEDGIFPEDNLPVIIFDDFTTATKYVDFPFKVKSSAMKILKAKGGIDIRFVFYMVQNIEFNASQHKRYWISEYSKIKIPLPPLNIQTKLANTLDKFTELEAEIKKELEAELEARKKQYKHYRFVLLDFEKVQQVPLSDIGKVSMCRRIFKNETSTAGDIPFYKIGTFGKTPDAFISKELYDMYRSKYSYPKKGDVLLSASGTIGRRVIYDGERAYFQDSNIVWIANDESKVLNKFLYHFYATVQWITEGGTISRLYNNNLGKIKVPVPKISEQERIVSILDRFDALVSDISIGLTAELKARRKQYEYYRSKLLTFNEYVG